MQHLLNSLVPNTVILTGLACWLSFAVFNNIRDPGTNTFLLGQMFRMDLLRDEPDMARGLISRAWTNPAAPRVVLRVVIGAQLTITALLWAAALLQIGLGLGFVAAPLAQLFVKLALTGFLGLWTAFLCGGMWFGYWMKTPQIQQVHLSLLMVALLAIIAAT